MHLEDIFAPVFQSIEEMLSHTHSDASKVELIDMLIKSLNQAKEKLRNLTPRD
jgi:hypothetical protein